MNTWITLTDTVSRLTKRSREFNLRTRSFRRRLAVFLAVVGPGLITSNVDNDAGGISTYSAAGAQFGYALLWSLIPMTIALYVSEEMCARMGVVTGKGLSDLIREEFGFRSTFFVMIAALAVDLFNTVAEFSGIAEGGEVLHISRYVSVPLAAMVVWLLVVYGTYRAVEKIFLVACAFYVSYVISAFLSKPDWIFAARETVIPSVQMNAPYLLMLIGLVGTTIAPWQFFYLQAGFVEKKVAARQYRHARLDVLVGSISCMVIVFFIIVACAATLNVHGLTSISSAKEAALALEPLAGKFAGGLFAFGLLNASLFAASILPLSTAHVICEGLGFEAGIDRKFKEAPTF
jgi:NRAMP (natural resistance-associated macrophage protein)-like metal ion transporter